MLNVSLNERNAPCFDARYNDNTYINFSDKINYTLLARVNCMRKQVFTL